MTVREWLADMNVGVGIDLSDCEVVRFKLIIRKLDGTYEKHSHKEKNS